MGSLGKLDRHVSNNNKQECTKLSIKRKYILKTRIV